MTFKFTIPLPPSANILFTNRRGTKHRIKTNDYRTWQEIAIFTIKRECIWAHNFFPFEKGTRWKVMMTVYFQDWRRDLDNVLKPSIDAMTKVFGLDDRYLVRLYASKEIGKPRIHVILRTL